MSQMTVAESIEELKKQLEAVSMAAHAVSVQKEKLKRQIRRRERLPDLSDLLPADVDPSWENRTRNVAAVAALYTVINSL